MISEFLAGRRVHRLREQLRGQVEVHAARAARHRRADRPGDADADVFGMQHAVSRLAQRLGDRELVHLFVVALLQVDDLALLEPLMRIIGKQLVPRGQAVEARTPSSRCSLDPKASRIMGKQFVVAGGQRRQPVEEAGGGHGQANAGLPRSGNRRPQTRYRHSARDEMK